jgi:hypothetical protein
LTFTIIAFPKKGEGEPDVQSSSLLMGEGFRVRGWGRGRILHKRNRIAAQFKNGGRNKGAIAENLERLEWFGLVMCREEGIKRWQYAEMQQAS